MYMYVILFFSFDYEEHGFEQADLVKVNVLYLVLNLVLYIIYPISSPSPILVLYLGVLLGCFFPKF